MRRKKVLSLGKRGGGLGLELKRRGRVGRAFFCRRKKRERQLAEGIKEDRAILRKEKKPLTKLLGGKGLGENE